MLETLRTLLEEATYDKNYQNIEVLGVVGYDDSLPTWEKLSTFDLDFSGKTVCDLGCFHAFFTIKAKQAGAAKVTGLDRSDELLSMSELIAECSDVEVEFQRWTGGEATPQCDIALVLNMLHHCEDQSLTLQNLNCVEAVFEVNPDQLEIIEQHFTILSMRQGRNFEGRPSRLLIHGKKRS
tara:strand:+ start:1976 stop:2518 length:543 start_codon:yes stop_codon:yes gene_type:complete